MASVTIKKHTLTSASSGQINHLYRTHSNYGNEDIDTNRSGQNILLGCQSADAARAALRDRIAAVDSVLPPKRRASPKSRIVAIEYCITAPRADMSLDEQIRFLRAAYKAMQQLYGADNIICGVIHTDEMHEYQDVDGRRTTSRAHLHIIGVPYVEDKGINGKQFLTRQTYQTTNRAMDDVCLQMYGYAYQDGSKQRSKGTVEQLKRGRQNAVSYEIAHKAATDAACAAKIEQTEQDIAARWAQADADYVERMEQLNESYDRRKADDDDYLTERRQKADDEIRAYAKSAKDKIDAEAAKLRRAKLGELESLQQRIEDLERKKDTLQDVVYDLQDDMDLMVMAGWLQSNGDVLAAAQELAAGDMRQDYDRYEQEHGR
jgi:hypothetical protein